MKKALSIILITACAVALICWAGGGPQILETANASFIVNPYRYAAAAGGWNDPNEGDLDLRLWMDPTSTGSGANVADTSGDANHMALVGNPTWTIVGTNDDSRVEHAYDFDGNDYLDCTNGAAFNTQAAGTISAWVYWDGAGGTSFQMIFSASDEDDASSDLTWCINSSEQPFIIVRDDGVTDYSDSTTTALSSNTWYHLVITQDGSTGYQGWINAVVAPSLSGNDTEWLDDVTAVDSATVGCRVDSGGPQNYWYGMIDDVRVYNVVLTPAAITNLYTYTHPTNNTESRP